MTRQTAVRKMIKHDRYRRNWIRHSGRFSLMQSIEEVLRMYRIGIFFKWEWKHRWQYFGDGVFTPGTKQIF